MGLRTGKIPMRRFTLGKMLTLYSVVFIGAIFLLCVALYIAFIMGAHHQLYSLADSEEKQVEALQKRINSEQYFDPKWTPPHIKYAVVNSKKQIIKSNMSTLEQKSAILFLNGKDFPYSEGHFAKVSYQKTTCIFRYRIGVRYYSDWANAYLPRVEVLFIGGLLVTIFIPTLFFVRAVTRRIRQDIFPLQKAVIALKQGDLNIPMPILKIHEFKELGTLTERMRLELKDTLEKMWRSEHQLKEETLQLLHDYRSPLTVARANIEFLKEDLEHLDCPGKDLDGKEKRENLLKYANTVVLNLELLTAVANKLQAQIVDERKILPLYKEQPTFREFNDSIHEMGVLLSEHYGAKWQSLIQDTQVVVPVDEKTFKQALANIIINALEHGHSPQSLCLEFMVSDLEAKYKITNSGSHFSDQALVHAIEKGFSEKKGSEQVIKGLGLAYVAKNIADKGGELLLSNTAEGHACVQLTIPLKHTDFIPPPQ